MAARGPAGVCRGKQRFDSFKRAENASVRSNRAKGREREHYQPYHCTACQGFHVGAKSLKTRARFRVRKGR